MMKRNHLLLAGMFVLVFVLAFGLAWLLFRRDPVPPPSAEPAAPATRAVSADELGAFLRAVDDGDFEAMKRLGGEAFARGNLIAEGRDRLADYETSSYSPDHLVYALYHHSDPDRVYRVILTLNEEGRVVSFMAEDMAVAR